MPFLQSYQPTPSLVIISCWKGKIIIGETMKEMEQKKKVGIQIDKNTYDSLRQESGKQYRTITSLVRKVLNEYLTDKGYDLITNK